MSYVGMASLLFLPDLQRDGKSLGLFLQGLASLCIYLDASFPSC